MRLNVTQSLKLKRIIWTFVSLSYAGVKLGKIYPRNLFSLKYIYLCLFLGFTFHVFDDTQP